MTARHSISSPGREVGWQSAGSEGEEVVERFGVVSLGMDGGNRFEDQSAQDRLDRLRAEVFPSLLSGGIGARAQIMREATRIGVAFI
jgi:hypothetical protein